MDDRCRQFQEAYGDTHLPEELMQHGQSCDLCRVFVQQQDALQKVLPAWKTPKFSQGFALNVMASLAEEQNKPRDFLDILRKLVRMKLSIPLPVSALASILLLVSLVLNFFYWTQNPVLAPGPIHIASGSPTQGNSAIGISTPSTQFTSVNPMEGSTFNIMAVPREWLGTGAFLMVPIMEPSLTLPLEKEDKNTHSNSDRGI